MRIAQSTPWFVLATLLACKPPQTAAPSAGESSATAAKSGPSAAEKAA